MALGCSPLSFLLPLSSSLSLSSLLLLLLLHFFFDTRVCVHTSVCVCVLWGEKCEAKGPRSETPLFVLHKSPLFLTCLFLFFYFFFILCFLLQSKGNQLGWGSASTKGANQLGWGSASTEGANQLGWVSANTKGAN